MLSMSYRLGWRFKLGSLTKLQNKLNATHAVAPSENSLITSSKQIKLVRYVGECTEGIARGENLPGYQVI